MPWRLFHRAIQDSGCDVPNAHPLRLIGQDSDNRFQNGARAPALERRTCQLRLVLSRGDLTSEVLMDMLEPKPDIPVPTTSNQGPFPAW
jgi:hypothetical protein